MNIKLSYKLAILFFNIILFSHCYNNTLVNDLKSFKSHTEQALPYSIQTQLENDPLPTDLESLFKQPFTLDQAMQWALNHHPQIQVALHELGIHRAQITQASLYENPHLEFTFLPERDSTFAFKVEYNLMSLVTAPLKKQIASHQLIAKRYQFASEVLSFLYTLKVHYYQLCMKQMQYALYEQQLSAIAENGLQFIATDAQDKNQIYPLIQAEQTYQQIKTNALRLSQQQLSLQIQLQQDLGIHTPIQALPIDHAVFETKPILLSEQAIQNQALEQHFLIQSIKQKIKALGAQSKLTTIHSWIPELDADFHLLSGFSGQKNHTGEATTRLGAGLRMQLPLFDRKQGTQAEQIAEQHVYEQKIKVYEQQLNMHIHKLLMQLNLNAQMQTQYRTHLIPNQEKLIHIERSTNAHIHIILESQKNLLSLQETSIQLKTQYLILRAQLDSIRLGVLVNAEPSINTLE